MAFQDISQPRKYVKYTDCNEGDVLVDGAWYTGSQEGKFGTQYIFRHEDGSETVLNKSGQLTYLIENKLQVNDFVKVVFAGSIVLTSGAYKGKPSNQFKIYVDSARSGKVASFREVGGNEEAEVPTDAESF